MLQPFAFASGSYILRNARLLFPDRIEPKGDLRVADGRIVAVAPALSPEPGETEIDLAERYVSPGFIDIHLHGALGRDTMEATHEAFETICRYHASGGTTALALTTITAETPDIVAVLEAATRFRESSYEGARLLGIHVEGPYFSPEKPGAHRPELIRNPTPKDYAPLLEYAKGPEKVMIQMTLAPELPGALPLISKLRELGVRVSGGHSDAWDEEACAAFVHGMEGVTHTFNCMSTARRRGPYRVAGLVEYALSEPGIVCELIADGRHVSPTLIRMLYLAKGPESVILVTDASGGAGLPEEEEFRLGEIKGVVRDRVGLTVDGKALAGSTSTMIRLVKTMVEEAGVSLSDAIRMATINPAKALNLRDRGALVKGARADLVILSEDLEVEATLIGGAPAYLKG